MPEFAQTTDTEVLPAVRTPAASVDLFHARVWDDSAQWVAWQAAQDAWLESKRRRSGGDNTVKTYRIAVRQFFEAFAIPPWQVSPAHAHAWAAQLTQAGLAQGTLGLKLAALSSFYQFVQTRYSVTTPDGRTVTLWPADRANPFATVERPRISPYGRSAFPTTEELQAILESINTRCLTGKRDFALLFTLATTCRRSSEVLNLRWGDLRRMDNGDYQFSYVYKGGKARRGVLSRQAFQAICAYLEAAGRPVEELRPEEYLWLPLFPDRIGRIAGREGGEARPLSNHQANAILQKYGRRAGVARERCHVHGLRHAGARLRVEQMKAARGGVDYMQLMELLGHSSLAVTQIYSQTCLEEPEDPGLEEAAQALLPKGPARKRRRPAGTQGRLL